MGKTQRHISLLIAGFVMVSVCAVRGADWPACRYDAAGSGATPEKLAYPLANTWRFKPIHAPKPAWPEPGKELHRIDIDYAFHPVVASGLVYFGSSADDTVRALEARSGKLKWRFTAGGPVRFAPAVANGKVYAASDDGFVYCLDGQTGELKWSFRAAPKNDRMLGNGRMISRWPLRSGVVVDGGTLYVTAGMWPYHGIYVYALDAETGKVRWRNADAGSMYIELPHAGASAFTGVCPQGQLVASADALIVPTGRSVPAAFDRKTGRLLYYKPGPSKRDGGHWAAVAGEHYFNPVHGGSSDDARIGESDPRSGDGMAAYALADGSRKMRFPGKTVVAIAKDIAYLAGDGAVEALRLKTLREGKTLQDARVWSAEHGRAYALIVAGDAVVVGGRGSISAFAIADGKPVWEKQVKGQVRGLVVAEGRLLAAMRTGEILCFESREVQLTPVEHNEDRVWDLNITPQQLADVSGVVKRSGVIEGYGLVMGERNCDLAIALASRTRLHVINVLKDEKRVASERARLASAGLCGVRVAVQTAKDLKRLPFGRWFANLVIVSNDPSTLSAKEAYRCLRPCGGELHFVNVTADQAKRFIKAGGVPDKEIALEKGSVAVRRGPLPGAGEWRWQHANSGRTGVGDDIRVRFPLDLLWFGGPGPDRMTDRHAGTSTPLFVNGRVFVTGQHHVIAFDAYNGRELWSREIHGAGRSAANWVSANFVADDDSLYLAVGDACYRLDQVTGQPLSVYRVPSRLEEPPEAAEPDKVHVDLAWPKMWQVVGPFPKGSAALPAEKLGSMPETFSVAGKAYTPRPLKAVKGFLVFPYLYGGYGIKPLGEGEEPPPYSGEGRRDMASCEKFAYAFATIECKEDGTLTIGAGADWWMRWYLDGKPIFDTFKRGNRSFPYEPSNHVFSTKVTAGKHVLCAEVKAGSMGWCMVSIGGAKYVHQLRGRRASRRPPVWGYIGATEGLVLGSRYDGKMQSNALFAMEKESGKVRWIHRTEQRVGASAIALHGQRAFFMDEKSRNEIYAAKRRGEKIEDKRTLVALAVETGSRLWKKAVAPKSTGWMTDVQCADKVVLVNGGSAFNAETGDVLWEKKIHPGRRPLILGDQIIAQPNSYDLRTGETRTTMDVLTGEKRPWRFTRAYGCGQIAGNRNLLVFRSGTFGILDLSQGATTTFGGVRPNCSVSMITAGGLLIAPEASSSCSCSYNFQTSLALAPSTSASDHWFILEGKVSPQPLKHVRLNFGAPGDRRDEAGVAWLSWPRPGLPGAYPIPIEIEAENPAYFYHPAETEGVRETKQPWLYSSGLRASGKITIGLQHTQPVVCETVKTAPTLDGELNDACWKSGTPVEFARRAHLADPRTELRIRRDDKNLYIALRRAAVTREGKALPLKGTAVKDDDNMRGDDRIEVLISDRSGDFAVQLGVSCAGGRFDACLTPEYRGWADRKWNGQWSRAVKKSEKEWRAELAIPMKTLADAKIDTTRLCLNVASFNVSKQGPGVIYLAKTPTSARNFHQCRALRPLVEKAGATPERVFTVRLHFAELGAAEAGTRLFDVKVAGKAALKGFNIGKVAGGGTRALVKEFKGVKAREALVLELNPSKKEQSAPPQLCAVEVIEE